MAIKEETKTSELRPVTPQELAHIVCILREVRKWSQEQLAGVSKLNVRTIQRVENGDPSSTDTRRALARAFDSEDIDVFNKPCEVPTPEQIQADKEKFEREHLTISCAVVTSGRELMTACATAMADQASPAIPLEGEAEEAFAELVDLMRDWRNCWDEMSEVSKLEGYHQAQDYLDKLSRLNLSVVTAVRTVKLTSKAWKDPTPWPVDVLYITAFKKGGEPEEFAVRRDVQFG